MKVFVGDTRSYENIRTLQRLRWGRIHIKPPKLFNREMWAFDNGAYGYWVRGEAFDESKYRQNLDAAYRLRAPYLSVVPDIVAQGLKSLDYSLEWMQKLPDDWPWYLAVQDGMTYRDVEGVIRGGFKGLFLGGTDKFKKQTAWRWCEMAHEFGLRFHYGRAGTLKKVRHAKQIGADSIDSSFPLWERTRWQRFQAEVADKAQRSLALR
jgi:hypothetical protein